MKLTWNGVLNELLYADELVLMIETIQGFKSVQKMEGGSWEQPFEC